MTVQSMKKTIFIIAAALIIAFFINNSCTAVDPFFAKGKNNEQIVYTMVNVCDESQQGDAHVLKFADNVVYVIDAGGGNYTARKKLEIFLKNKNISTIDKLFISHAHKDHYEGIFNVIKSGIKIKTVYFNLPNKEACDREKPWGCDYDDVLRTLTFIRDHGIPVETLKANDLFFPEKDVTLQVLAVFDGNNTPVGKTDINDTSMIMKLVYGNTSILFAGDLNVKLGSFFVQYPYNVKADILKVPHHGAESVAPNAFFDAVSPELALVPAPKDLWLSDRSKRIRDYFSSKKIPVLVSGINGDVTVILYKDRFEIEKK